MYYVTCYKAAKSFHFRKDSEERFRRQRDKNNSLRFYLTVNEEQSNQAREKNAHLTCGEDRWLTRTIRTELFTSC